MGVCDGDDTTCLDCAGVPNGNASLDACGNCNGDCTQDVNQNSLIICSSQEFNSNNLVVADCAGEWYCCCRLCW